MHVSFHSVLHVLATVEYFSVILGMIRRPIKIVFLAHHAQSL